MRKSLIPALLLALLAWNLTVSATVTQTSPSPPNDATGVWINTPSFTLQLNATNGNMNGYINMSNGDTLTVTNQANGTQILTLTTPLNELTTYQIWANITDTDGYTNSSYNFTTGTTFRLSEQEDIFSTTQIVIIGIAIVLLFLGILYYIKKDLIDNKNANLENIVKVIFACVIIVIIAMFI